MTPTRPLRALTLALLGLALATRVLVPGGWMPAVGQGVAITLCTGSGAEQMVLGLDGKLRKQKPAGQAADHPCAFAGTAAPLADAGPVAIEPRIVAADVLEAVQPRAAIGHGLAAPPPPSTGPPALI